MMKVSTQFWLINLEQEIENHTLDEEEPPVIIDPVEEKPKNPLIEIDDYNSMSYFAEFSLGSNKQDVRLAFSTASPVSVVNSQNCEGCDESSYGYEY